MWLTISMLLQCLQTAEPAVEAAIASILLILLFVLWRVCLLTSHVSFLQQIVPQIWTTLGSQTTWCLLCRQD
ncbi:hypothetical protein PM082_013566 [Marasmius tenuissimus]|nr:hypothetical protein PM082_013566 [Marasmius tenuissimus]